MRSNSIVAARWLALLVPLALIAGALGSQYLGGLFPCEMCHWQRWPHYGAIVLAALSFLVPRRTTGRALIIAAALLVAISGGIGIFHAGVEYRWWEGVTQCTSTALGGGSTEDALKSIMSAPIIRCDVAQWTLFGISLAGWNAIVSLSGAGAILYLATRRRA